MLTVVTAADGNYALQASVLARSLAITQTHRTILVVLGNGWTDKQKFRLRSLESDILSIKHLEVDNQQFSDVRLTNRFPLATVYNILAPRYLLNTSEAFLYVDADVVVRKNLASLIDKNSDYAVSACLDAHIGWIANPTMWRPWVQEGLKPSTPYLNTGVLYINPIKWNELEVTERTLSLLRKYDLPCVDQDALNLVLAGEFEVLPPVFNSMPYHLLSTFRHVDLVTPREEIQQAICDPTVIHFHRSFLGKPWEMACIHPFRALWTEIADDIQPAWRKKLDLIGLARRRAAKAARMLSIDQTAAHLTWKQD